MTPNPKKLTKKDFSTDQDVRWCPGCGDYAILAAMQKALADTGAPRENTVFISGIGCSSRFPYYMNTFGFHSIHGRAPAIATGLKVARPELSVWVITGDGDGLSIGGNHLLHALRRNVDLNIILFNNQIYGLTKGQYSPTSSQGTKAPSTPMGSLDYPVNPISVALGANASFIARVIDVDAASLVPLLKRAEAHKGTSFIEVLQNCPVFNDGVWEPVAAKPVRGQRLLQLKDGEPLRFGNDNEFAIKVDRNLRPKTVIFADTTDEEKKTLVVHDEKAGPAYVAMLASMQYPKFPMPMGVLRCEEKPTYDAMVSEQLNQAISEKGPGDLKALLHSGMTWEVGPDGKPI